MASQSTEHSRQNPLPRRAPIDDPHNGSISSKIDAWLVGAIAVLDAGEMVAEKKSSETLRKKERGSPRYTPLDSEEETDDEATADSSPVAEDHHIFARRKEQEGYDEPSQTRYPVAEDAHITPGSFSSDSTLPTSTAHTNEGIITLPDLDVPISSQYRARMLLSDMQPPILPSQHHAALPPRCDAVDTQVSNTEELNQDAYIQQPTESTLASDPTAGSDELRLGTMVYHEDPQQIHGQDQFISILVDWNKLPSVSHLLRPTTSLVQRSSGSRMEIHTSVAHPSTPTQNPQNLSAPKASDGFPGPSNDSVNAQEDDELDYLYGFELQYPEQEEAEKRVPEPLCVALLTRLSTFIVNPNLMCPDTHSPPQKRPGWLIPSAPHAVENPLAGIVASSSIVASAYQSDVRSTPVVDFPSGGEANASPLLSIDLDTQHVPSVDSFIAECDHPTPRTTGPVVAEKSKGKVIARPKTTTKPRRSEKSDNPNTDLGSIDKATTSKPKSAPRKPAAKTATPKRGVKRPQTSETGSTEQDGNSNLKTKRRRISKPSTIVPPKYPKSAFPAHAPAAHATAPPYWLKDPIFAKARAKLVEDGGTGSVMEFKECEDDCMRVRDGAQTKVFPLCSLRHVLPAATGELVIPISGAMRGVLFKIRERGQEMSVVRQPGHRLKRGEVDPSFPTHGLAQVFPPLRFV